MKAPGHDSIGTKIISLCPDIFAENLSKIFNKAILQGVYPATMKIAKVIALFKGGIKSKPNNYRPISLLSHFDKIFEKMLCKRLVAFFEQKHIILPPIRISKIVFYSNGVEWNYRQYQAPSRRKELCNMDIYWLQEGVWHCWSWNHVAKIRLWYSRPCKYVLQIISS